MNTPAEVVIQVHPIGEPDTVGITVETRGPAELNNVEVLSVIRSAEQHVLAMISSSNRQSPRDPWL